MEFKKINELKLYLRKLQEIGFGSRGTCFLNRKNGTVFKVFHGFDEIDEDYSFNYSSEEILRFRNISNDTFVWPQETIVLDGKIIGYTIPFVDARNLYMTDPLKVNLDSLERSIMRARKDLKLISDKGIVTYDMLYNILYGKKFFVIDQDEYSFNRYNSPDLEKENNNNFDLEIYYFLIDAYFNGIVNDNKDLSELYNSKKEDVLIFIQLLRKRLSELVGKDIKSLETAKKYIDKGTKQYVYQRILK